ncbi:MAG: MAC/perforin domain-containing protein [Candidatus Chryseobacterium colombiense]|nr:MAC/perforin domain-containing protein [Chryseobacterium sp.]WEK68440.1 MAG: MAC/perforin domain-containing protein [Chryseobacterium sp.]
MKKLLFLSSSVMLMALATSCSATNDDIINQENNESWEHIKLPNNESSKPLGAYNALGYGYNVLGEYASENSVALPIIDIEKFKTEESQRLSEENILSQEYKEDYGEDAAAFSKTISGRVSATEKLKVFGETIPFSSAILNNKKYDAAYIYGSYNLIIKQKRFRLNATPELLSNYLTANFVKDLEEKTPEQIIKDYGTHVAVDVYIGSALNMIFQAKTTNSNRENAARIGVKKYITGNSNDIDVIEAAKNYEKKLYYKTRGGDKTLAMVGIFNLEKITPSINHSNWQSTSTKENSVLVDFGNNGLIAIYDLVRNPVKKAELKSYTDQYLIDHQVTIN